MPDKMSERMPDKMPNHASPHQIIHGLEAWLRCVKVASQLLLFLDHRLPVGTTRSKVVQGKRLLF